MAEWAQKEREGMADYHRHDLNDAAKARLEGDCRDTKGYREEPHEIIGNSMLDIVHQSPLVGFAVRFWGLEKIPIELYKQRHLIENTFLHLKRWRGIAARYVKMPLFSGVYS